MNKIFEIVDLFCGGGGTTEGFKRAFVDGLPIAKVVACINHDKFAIDSHLENHPDCVHFTEDITKFDVTNLPAMNPENYSILWASLECTNFSKAKGGKPRDADSRTLANYLFKYIAHINPDYIMIENVREFMAWGDLDENGKPLSMDKGKKYQQWVKKVEKCGYKFDYRLLNCADYGAYQSRLRFFGIFAKDGFPIKWPEPTHSKKGGDLFGLKKWRGVIDVLDLEDEGNSIFGRKKDLSDNTLKRIYEGLKKFSKREDFILKFNSAQNNSSGMNYKNCSSDVEDACPTVATQNRLGKIFLSKYYGGSPQCKSTDESEPAVIKADFISQRYSGNNRNLDINRPTGAVTTTDHHHIVNTEYLISFNYKDKPVDINNPAPTILTKDRLAKVVPVQFIDLQFSNGTRNQSIDNPAQGITTVPKHNLVTSQYIIDRQYNNKSKSIEKPARTVLATEGKKPMYLITATAAMDENDNVYIVIYDDDSESMKLIKEFMAENGIIDVKMRMLNIKELMRIMGVGDKYILKGSQEKQKWMIGNMVHPVHPETMAITLWNELRDWEMRKAA